MSFLPGCSGRSRGGIQRIDPSRHHPHIQMRLHAVAESPVDVLRVVWVDVLIDGYNDFPQAGVVTGSRVQSLPCMTVMDLVHLDNHIVVGSAVLMAGDIQNARDVAVVFKMLVKHRLPPDSSDRAAFARRELADVGVIDWIATVSDALDVEDRTQDSLPYVAGEFSERGLGFQVIRGNNPF